MLGTFPVEEAGTIVNAKVHPGSPGQSQVESGGKRVALVVVEKAERVLAESSGDQAAGDIPVPFRMLMGVSETPGNTVRQPRRRGAHFPAADAGALQSEREKDIGVAQSIVVEEVLRPSAKIGNIEGPALERNRQAEFVLFVAFAVEGCERTRFARLIALVDDRSGNGEQRGRLIVASVRRARH